MSNKEAIQEKVTALAAKFSEHLSVDKEGKQVILDITKGSEIETMVAESNDLTGEQLRKAVECMSIASSAIVKAAGMKVIEEKVPAGETYKCTVPMGQHVTYTASFTPAKEIHYTNPSTGEPGSKVDPMSVNVKMTIKGANTPKGSLANVIESLRQNAAEAYAINNDSGE